MGVVAALVSLVTEGSCFTHHCFARLVSIP
jgi:hypothetical protein